VFSNNAYADGIGNHPDFIQTFGQNGYGSMGHLIEGNWVIGIEAGQLGQLSSGLLPTIRDWTFRNNIFAHIGMQLSCTMPEVRFFNNIFYRCNYVNGGHALNFGSRYIEANYYGTNGTQYAHGATVINNVFLDCGNGTATKGWYFFERGLSNVVADYNFVAINGSQPVRLSTDGPVGDPDGYWDNFKWFEYHGINGGDPRFANPSALDFRPREGSPLIGRGLNLGGLFATDILGRTRTGAWDIGPYAYSEGSSTEKLRPPRIRYIGPVVTEREP
jgi:hypothetical protein